MNKRSVKLFMDKKFFAPFFPDANLQDCSKFPMIEVQKQNIFHSGNSNPVAPGSRNNVNRSISQFCP